MMHHRHHHRKRRYLFGFQGFMSFLEGIESGFATTTGILLGLWFKDIALELIAITAVVSILINAVNNASVKFITEHAMDERDGREKRRVFINSLVPALVQFMTHIIMSMIVLLPVLVVHPLIYGIFASIGLTMLVLFTAGWYRGQSFHSSPLRDALEATLLGMLIITAGGVAGWLL